MTVTPSTNRRSGPTPTDRATGLRPGPGALVVAGSALVGLLVVAVVASAVAGLLAAPGTRPFTVAELTTATAPRDESAGDTRHGSGPDAAARRGPTVGEGSAQGPGPWLLVGLRAPARAAVETDLAHAIPAVQPVLRGLAGSVSVDAATGDCRGGAPSCSYAGQGLDGRWGIHLDAQTTSATYPSNRFLVYHEIGHAVWGLLMDDRDRQAFAVAVRSALHGGPCVESHGRPCAVLGEVFADEFARYAGGFAVSMSYYGTPSLLDVRTFAELAPHWGTAPAAPGGDAAPLTGVLWWRRP